MGDDGDAALLQRAADLGVDAACLQALAASDQKGGATKGPGLGTDLANGVTTEEDFGRVFQDKIFPKRSPRFFRRGVLEFMSIRLIFLEIACTAWLQQAKISSVQ